MEDIEKDITRLINEQPVDDANVAQSANHFNELVEEEVNAAKLTGLIITDKQYITMTVKDALFSNLKSKIRSWIELKEDVLNRSDVFLRANHTSGVDSKERELYSQAEEEKNKVKEDFIRNNQYHDLKKNSDESRIRYESMRKEFSGKPPVKKNLFLYVVSILGIGFVEWFINYSTFNVKYPPGLAFGATILMALSIAFSSHFLGALLKQRQALFSASKKKSDKIQTVMVQLIFSLLIIFAMAVITYTRYDVLSDQLIDNSGFSLPGLAQETDVTSSVWNELYPFILMNLLVWVLGVAISYFTHDSRPDYQEAYSEYIKSRSRFNYIDKKLESEFKRLDEEYKEKISNLKNSYGAEISAVKELNQLMKRLQHKEVTIFKKSALIINDALERHQSLLVTQIKNSNLNDVKIGPGALSVDEYLSRNIKLSDDLMKQELGIN